MLVTVLIVSLVPIPANWFISSLRALIVFERSPVEGLDNISGTFSNGLSSLLVQVA